MRKNKCRRNKEIVMKRNVVFAVIIFSLLSLGCVSVFAASENGYNYTVSTSGEATITYCAISKSGSVTIPDTLGGYPVTSIGARAFANCKNITRISIPSSVKSIGERAFYNCQNVTYIYIPSSVTSIGDSAFTRCNSLDRIAVSNDNTEFSELFTVKGLYNKNGTKLLRHVGSVLLGKITLPSSVTSIGNCAFEERYDITEITIPNSVTNIGDSAFYNCTGLKSVTIGNKVMDIGKDAFFSCSELSNISLPNGVKSIGAGAFYNCTKLVSIAIPNTVTSLGNGVFSGCSGLADITIGSGIKSIASTTFYNCSSLKNITIPNGVTSIEPSAFQDCKNLTSITLPSSINEIGAWAFKNCSKLSNVYYSGTQEIWKTILIGEENNYLTKAVNHYIPSNGTQTTVSNDKKIFTVNLVDFETGKFVIIALYDNGKFVEMQCAIHKGEEITFTTDKTYTNAKVMVWDDITILKPVCSVEELN